MAKFPLDDAAIILSPLEFTDELGDFYVVWQSAIPKYNIFDQGDSVDEALEKLLMRVALLEKSEEVGIRKPMTSEIVNKLLKSKTTY